MDGAPNFEEKFFVPVLKKPLSDEEFGQLAGARNTLLQLRGTRPKPLTDTKIITSWNGLAIRGLADSGRILDRPQDIERAIQAANFLKAQLRDSNGHLLRNFAEGKASLSAYLDDYAFFINGLIALHQATGDDQWQTLAKELIDIQIDLFWDETDGGFFFTSKDHEELIARSKQSIDGVQPSGNAVSAANLVYLGTSLNDTHYSSLAQRTVEFAAGAMAKRPGIAPQMDITLALLADEK